MRVDNRLATQSKGRKTHVVGADPHGRVLITGAGKGSRHESEGFSSLGWETELGWREPLTEPLPVLGAPGEKTKGN